MNRQLCRDNSCSIYLLLYLSRDFTYQGVYCFDKYIGSNRVDLVSFSSATEKVVLGLDALVYDDLHGILLS